MLSATWRSAARAVFGVAAAFWLSPAFAHAVCGDRIFPATLGIDDPGVGDELALPTLTYLPQNSSGAQEFDASFSYTKTIFPGFGLSVSDGPTWLRPGGYGWGDVDTEAKYNFLCVPQWEFMASAGLDVTWAHTGTPNMTNPFNTYTPVLDIGLGFGGLPKSLNILRPLAVTAELSETIPGQAWTDGNQNPTSLNWGFTIQYSLPYYNSHVGRDRQRFLQASDPRHRIHLLEADLELRAGNRPDDRHDSAGRDLYGRHVAIRARSDRSDERRERPRVGVVGELHFFLDDIFPDSLGKPISKWGQP